MRISTSVSVTAGLIVCPLFGLTVLLQDLLRNDFDSVQRFISELAIGPSGWVQIVNFLVSGALIMLFSRAVTMHCSNRKSGRLGSHLLAIIGASMFFGGLFVADPLGTPPGEGTWHGSIHLIFGLLVFSLIPAGCFVFFRYFSRDEGWRGMLLWTFLTAAAAGGFWIMLIPAGAIPAVATALDPLLAPVYARIGLANRIVVGIWLFWVLLFALHLRRRDATLSGSHRMA